MPIDDPDTTVRQIEFELEKAEHGMGMPYDPERVGHLRNMLREARKRKLSGAAAPGRIRNTTPAKTGGLTCSQILAREDENRAPPIFLCAGRSTPLPMSRTKSCW